MKLIESFQNHANAVLLKIHASMPVQEIEAELRCKSILAPRVSQAEFEKLFWAYLSAQVSQHWKRCCLEHKVDSKEIQNLFFRTVLDDYASKKDLTSAAGYSEAMYAANAKEDQEPLVSILADFFKKLGASQSLTATEVAEPFRWLATIWEGYCNNFDNEFDDFIAYLRVQESAPNLKRG
jgi:hypothetical protein